MLCPSSAAIVAPKSEPAAGLAQAVRYWIGVDGGGTHTRLRLWERRAADWVCLGEGQAGPSALGQGVGQAWRQIGEALAAAAVQAGHAVPHWAQCALGLGLSGANDPALAQAFRAADPGCARLALASDALTGVLGAHGGQPGALLIAGTGSVALALHADGRQVAVGGWGWLNGDEGSGAWIGKAVMQHAQRALDHRDPAGPLAQAIWARCGASAEALLAWCAESGQARYASLAPLAFDCAAQDPAAARLLQEAVQQLEAMVAAVDPQASLPLVLSGTVAARLAPQFSAALRARVVVPQGDALDGALRLLQSA
ncbi:glucosamine kinase [Inhella inkyongensis]|uniref:Glucosamine kinase n=1 Tax=Inhella inkyongensis TaxID=392593 RepID=A0A840SBA0_9BURK|nr:BadF/BadG/BcrA/BcrD ATPase family protein [Inhella inkyongensis]MBB5205629.1 glucosamine kinase [Inhella inkyongensis]